MLPETESKNVKEKKKKKTPLCGCELLICNGMYFERKSESMRTKQYVLTSVCSILASSHCFDFFLVSHVVAM